MFLRHKSCKSPIICHLKIMLLYIARRVIIIYFCTFLIQINKNLILNCWQFNHPTHLLHLQSLNHFRHLHLKKSRRLIKIKLNGWIIRSKRYWLDTLAAKWFFVTISKTTVKIGILHQKYNIHCYATIAQTFTLKIIPASPFLNATRCILNLASF